MSFKIPLTLAVGILLPSCEVEAPLGRDNSDRYRVVVDTPALLRNKLDLLFVVDNSENMASRQAQLASSFPVMLESLNFGRGMPDMHISVVSTDMGVAGFSDIVPGCSATGDGGTLAPRDCELADPFMALQHDADGKLLTNFEGEAGKAFECMTQLGEQGCDYEQPLAAMQRALDGSQAATFDFMRDDAALGVVLLTDEDDCSAFDPTLFNPLNPTFEGDSPEFRCFQSGVICDGDDVLKPGLRDGCRPRSMSNYMVSVSDYTDFIDEIKPEPRDRVLTGIIGDPDRVEIGVGGFDAELLPACKDEMGTAAYPGVRLGSFLDSFTHGEISPLCQPNPSNVLDGMVRNLRQTMGTTCLEGTISDVDQQRPGRQEQCYVYEQQPDGDRKYFHECDRPGNFAQSTHLPCYSIETGGEACGDFRTQLALQIHGRDDAPSVNTRLIAECVVDEDE